MVGAETTMERAPRRADVDWDREWAMAWKADAGNPWFGYQAAVQADYLRRRASEEPRAEVRRTLKTDVFEEACGFLPEPVFESAMRVLMDVSPVILRQGVRQARRDGGRADACVTDARRLAFRAGVFDRIVSLSTLDHFDDAGDIEVAFRELARVLAPGGRFMVTLDNPSNPILRARQAMYGRLGAVGGLIPFPMGRTFSRAQLARALEAAGLEVLRSGYLVHTPRIVGLWLGEWAARGRRLRTARVLGALFWAVERVFAVLPTRRWTGHYVVAECRRC
jgi:SAM-dependent methyltransferase